MMSFARSLFQNRLLFDFSHRAQTVQQVLHMALRLKIALRCDHKRYLRRPLSWLFLKSFDIGVSLFKFLLPDADASIQENHHYLHG